jgi:hypothetical protein
MLQGGKIPEPEFNKLFCHCLQADAIYYLCNNKMILTGWHKSVASINQWTVII